MSHTPTPWAFDEGSPGSSEYAPDPACIGTEDGNDVICWINDNDDPKETWVANAEFIVKAVNCHDELLAACIAFRQAAIDAFGHWDQDRDMKVGKLLIAMAGYSTGYRHDLTTAHAAIAKAQGDSV